MYDRARRALRRQLQSLGPTLSEADIAREESLLETAIARVEEQFAPARPAPRFSPPSPPSPSPPPVAPRFSPPPLSPSPSPAAPRFSPPPPARTGDLPARSMPAVKDVDITTHTFDAALSFPGEVRRLVAQVAKELESRLGPSSYFYDKNYVSQLARPSLDSLLQDIYQNRAKLVVVFLGSDYQRKDWCGIEFRAIREIIAERDHKRVMFVRTDDGVVEGVFRTDGYVDARKYKASQIAQFIVERVKLLAATRVT
jgi:hypothetical protein